MSCDQNRKTITTLVGCECCHRGFKARCLDQNWRCVHCADCGISRQYAGQEGQLPPAAYQCVRQDK